MCKSTQVITICCTVNGRPHPTHSDPLLVVSRVHVRYMHMRPRNILFKTTSWNSTLHYMPVTHRRLHNEVYCSQPHPRGFVTWTEWRYLCVSFGLCIVQIWKKHDHDWGHLWWLNPASHYILCRNDLQSGKTNGLRQKLLSASDYNVYPNSAKISGLVQFFFDGERLQFCFRKII